MNSENWCVFILILNRLAQFIMFKKICSDWICQNCKLIFSIYFFGAFFVYKHMPNTNKFCLKPISKMSLLFSFLTTENYICLFTMPIWYQLYVCKCNVRLKNCKWNKYKTNGNYWFLRSEIWGMKIFKELYIAEGKY